MRHTRLVLPVQKRMQQDEKWRTKKSRSFESTCRLIFKKMQKMRCELPVLEVQ